MDTAPIIILALYGLAALVALVLLIFLIRRRIRIKKEETFEKRDN
jgi:hypothetical protein